MAPPSPVAQPDGPAIAVRPAGLSDLPTLVAIDALCFPAGISYSRAEISALLRSPSAVTLVAASSATLVGFAVLEILPPRRSFPRRPSGELVTLDVLPEFRRRRVGHLLYRAVEDRLRARNGTHIGLLPATRLRLRGACPALLFRYDRCLANGKALDIGHFLAGSRHGPATGAWPRARVAASAVATRIERSLLCSAV